jgi:hypothetical protein
MSLIAALEDLERPPLAEPALHHDRRYVKGVFLAGWKLGRAEIEDWILGDSGVVGLVLNPPSSLRRTSPVLVGGMDTGKIRWVAPFSPQRVVLGDLGEFPGTTEALRTAFADFWDDVLFGLETVIDNPTPQMVWDPGTRFGDLGAELGASGTAVHPMIPLLGLNDGLRLWCAISASQQRAGRFFSTYSDEDVIDTQSGAPLIGKRGLIEGKRGQVELAHFAVLSGAAWTEVAAQLSARAIGSIADTLANVWARDMRGGNNTNATP